MLDLFIAATVAGTAPTGPELSGLLPGTYSNEEQNYFENEAGRKAPPWMSLKIENHDGKWTISEIDAYGTEIAAKRKVSVAFGAKRDSITVGSCSRFFDRTATGWSYSAMQTKKICAQKYQIIRVAADGIVLRLSDGSETILKRARTVACWAALPKLTKKNGKTTGSEFFRKLTMHDQGGRVSVGGKESDTETITLRMRTVHWPKASNLRPSMVMYVHKDDPVKAASYSWGDIHASRLGINVRWMQASCTIEGAGPASEVSTDNFRG